MKAIRVRNLRSFANDETQPYVELKPLTIFIGKNSCGKSTLLRTLPLFRQSIEERTSGPVLWYGTYVDFGMFQQAKNKNSKENEITFDIILNHQETDINVSICLTAINKETIFKKISISFINNIIEFDFISHLNVALSVNGHYLEDKLNYHLRPNKLLPAIFNINTPGPLCNKSFNTMIEKLFDFYDYDYFEDDDLHDVSEKTKLENKFDDFISEFDLDISDEIYTSPKKLIKGISEDLFYFERNDKTIPTKIQNEIFHLYLKSFSNKFLNLCNELLVNELREVKYIAPLRATAERYYRFQDFRVNELDHTGSNLAMLLRSLKLREIRRFQTWTDENFGFKVHIKEEGLHYEIMIEIDKNQNNVSDMGFGFSQILPIITSLWAEQAGVLSKDIITFGRKSRNKIFVIEQPELHLHPELQAKLAIVFLKIATKLNKTGEANTKIIFETHSKTMIDAIGDEIENNTSLREHVNIVIFNKEKDRTNITSTKFDEEGDLIDWPIGFFSGL
ncbi:AAA family ATPase [Vibrio vulnificus]|uniref:AAA family ATPase n=1 Tax=Vibrio vulnificus TaxID=672 RepID=UPI003133BB23